MVLAHESVNTFVELSGFGFDSCSVELKIFRRHNVYRILLLSLSFDGSEKVREKQ